jgi:hypothetical protein
MARNSSHRHRGQTETGSWAACRLARLGKTAVAALATLSFIAPAGAIAASHGASPDPSPQPAPAVAPSTPAPDPAPQAVTKAVSTATSVQSRPSTYQPSSGSSTGTSSTQVIPSTGTSSAQVIPSTGTSSTQGAAPTGSGTAVVHTTPTSPAPDDHTRSASSTHTGAGSSPHHGGPHAGPRQVAVAHRAAPRIAPFPLSLPKSLLELPRAAFHAGVQEHRNGVLLLLSSVAMGVLAVASFTLLRRLRRLEGSLR